MINIKYKFIICLIFIIILILFLKNYFCKSDIILDNDYILKSKLLKKNLKSLKNIDILKTTIRLDRIQEKRKELLYNFVKDSSITDKLEKIFYEREIYGNEYKQNEYLEILNNLAKNKKKVKPKLIPVLYEKDYNLLEHYIDEKKPVILKNYFKNIDKIYSVDSILKKHYYDKVILTDENNTMYDILGKITKNKKIYAQNISDITEKDNTYNKKLPVKLINKIKKGLTFYSTQIFLSVSKNTGTPFHCAYDDNLFFMLEGRKKWTFIDPAYTFLIHPYITKCRNYFISLTGSNINISKKMSPLYDYIPKYEYTLEPGDLLYNPSLWWHSINNETEKTLGMSSRWFTNDHNICCNLWMTKVMLSDTSSHYRSLVKIKNFQKMEKGLLTWSDISTCGYKEIMEKYPYVFKRFE